jgi:hypothetical protein
MTTTLIGLRHCPGCGGSDLIPVVAGMETNFYCQDCRKCWHLLDRAVTSRVEPELCPGCILGKATCAKPPRRPADYGWPDIESELLCSVREACMGFCVLPAE